MQFWNLEYLFHIDYAGRVREVIPAKKAGSFWIFSKLGWGGGANLNPKVFEYFYVKPYLHLKQGFRRLKTVPTLFGYYSHSKVSRRLSKTGGGVKTPFGKCQKGSSFFLGWPSFADIEVVENFDRWEASNLVMWLWTNERHGKNPVL